MSVSYFTMAQAKRDFMAGYMKDFKIERAPMGEGWVVLCRVALNMVPLVDARDRTPRVFKTLDAAVAALEQIGFVVTALLKA